MQIENYGFSQMESKFIIKKKTMIEWAYVSWKSSFPYEVYKMLKAKSERCIMNAVKTSCIGPTIKFIGWILYKLSAFTWKLELFEKLGVFFLLL